MTSTQRINGIEKFGEADAVLRIFFFFLLNTTWVTGRGSQSLHDFIYFRNNFTLRRRDYDHSDYDRESVSIFFIYTSRVKTSQ